MRDYIKMCCFLYTVVSNCRLLSCIMPNSHCPTLRDATKLFSVASSSSFYLPNNTTVCTSTSIQVRRAGQQGPTRTLTAALKRSIKQLLGRAYIFYHTSKILQTRKLENQVGRSDLGINYPSHTSNPSLKIEYCVCSFGERIRWKQTPVPMVSVSLSLQVAFTQATSAGADIGGG